MTLFDLADRQMADTSLDAYAHVRQTLAEREYVVFAALWSLGEATGGELAEFLNTLPTSTRPRLSGLEDKGLIAKGPIRQSRARYEGRCRPYRPVVPLAAVTRRSA